MALLATVVACSEGSRLLGLRGLLRRLLLLCSRSIPRLECAPRAMLLRVLLRRRRRRRSGRRLCSFCSLLLSSCLLLDYVLMTLCRRQNLFSGRDFLVLMHNQGTNIW